MRSTAKRARKPGSGSGRRSAVWSQTASQLTGRSFPHPYPRTLHEGHQAGQWCGCPGAKTCPGNPALWPRGQHDGLGGAGTRAGASVGAARRAVSARRLCAISRTLLMQIERSWGEGWGGSRSAAEKKGV